MKIDLNCDLGEVPIAASAPDRNNRDDILRRDKQVMEYVSSVNIACGGHAGDADSMTEIMEQAKSRDIAIGAHPSYADPAHFGRRDLDLPRDQLISDLCRQLDDFRTCAQACAVQPAHIKPHGALYNRAAIDPDVARSILEAIGQVFPDRAQIAVMGLAGGVLVDDARAAGHPVIREGFADRAYDEKGRLVSRNISGSVIEDHDQAVAQALALAKAEPISGLEGSKITLKVDSLCLHSDTPAAIERARRLHQGLTAAGFIVRATSA